MSETERRIRRHVEREHTDVLDRIDHAGAIVANSLDPDGADDGADVRRRLRTVFDEAGVLSALPAVLETAVSAVGCTLPAPPVPAPPYVVVTTRGPLVRATIDPGRLVVRFDVFDVDHCGRSEYGHLEGVDVTIKLVPRSASTTDPP